MKLLPIDQTYVQDVLFRLLSTPSPSGFTDHVVHLVADELDAHHEVAAADLADHVEIAEAMGGLDFDQAAKISGARFAYLIGPIARLQFALISFVVDRVEREGFTPVVPPVMPIVSPIVVDSQ